MKCAFVEAFVEVASMEAFVEVTSMEAFVEATSMGAFVEVRWKLPCKLSRKLLPWKLEASVEVMEAGSFRGS